MVILSVCYGPGPDGRVLMHFGPINQAGGEKRLNVAFSRARCHMAVVSSMHGDAITNDHTEGARCLKTYLRYAEALSAGNATAARLVLRDAGGPLAAPSRDDQATPDAVVDQLAAALAERGWQTARDVGQSAFRCDLAVYRDDDPSYRAAVLVDTDAAYRRADVLEREVLRPKLLRAFGWNVVHVLTKDWRDDREGVLKEIESILTPG